MQQQHFDGIAKIEVVDLVGGELVKRRERVRLVGEQIKNSGAERAIGSVTHRQRRRRNRFGGTIGLTKITALETQRLQLEVSDQVLHSRSHAVLSKCGASSRRRQR